MSLFNAPRVGIGDTLLNVVTGIGTAKDPRSSTCYTLCLLDKNTLENMYRGDWMSRRLVDLPAHDATREWRTWQMDAKKVQAIKDLENKLFVQRKVYQALVRSRLYGGGALVIGVDQGYPDEELDLDAVGKGDLKFVVVVNKYELAAGPRIYDVESPYYTRPQYYTVSTPLYGFMGETYGKGGTWPYGNAPSYKTTTSLELPRREQGQAPPAPGGGDRAAQMYSPALVRLHPSRVIEFNGNELPDWRLAPLGGLWGDSILQTAQDALKDFGMSIAGLSAMINDMKMDVVKIPNMSDRIVTKAYQEQLITRFTVANTAKSTINSILLDKEEEWDRIQTQFGGTADLLRVLMTVTCAAAGVPESRLMGSAPSKGLAASGSSGGEVDVRNYFDDIMSDQRTVYQPALYTLDRCLVQSATGSWDPGDVYTWNPLYKPDPAQVATVALQNAQATAAYVQMGLINEDALRDAVISQLVEAKTYPALEDAIEEYGAEPEVEEPPPGMMEPGKWEPNPLVQQKLQNAHQKSMAPIQNAHAQKMAKLQNAQGVGQPNQLQLGQANNNGGSPPPDGGVVQKRKAATDAFVRDITIGSRLSRSLDEDYRLPEERYSGPDPDAIRKNLRIGPFTSEGLDELIEDFNPNHDPKTGRFTPGKATEGSGSAAAAEGHRRRSEDAKAAHAKRRATAAEDFPLAAHASEHQVGWTAVQRVIAAKRGHVTKGEMAAAAREDIKTAVASWAATRHLKEPKVPGGVDPDTVKTAYRLGVVAKRFFQDPQSKTILSQAVTRNSISWLKRSAHALPGHALPGHALDVAHKALVDRIVDYTTEGITDVVLAGVTAGATAVGGLAGGGAAAAAAPILHAEIDKAVENIAERIGFTPKRIKEALHGAGRAILSHYRKWRLEAEHGISAFNAALDAEPGFDPMEAALEAFAKAVG